MTRRITVLGSTGSIGASTLDVIARHPDKYAVHALTANTRVDELEQQCLRWRPAFAVMNDENQAQELAKRLQRAGGGVEVLHGVSGLQQVAADERVDTVVAAIVGAAGLLPTLAAVEAGKRILLANKEALVMSGQLFIDAVEKHHAHLLPVDSEHNAIFQCMPSKCQDARLQKSDKGVLRLLLTASGGPFRTMPVEQLAGVTPEQAVAHPNWSMGHKISVDSATMMNKGLELIEAYWLFGLGIDKIDVVVHPQSIIHSMVSYNDGSVLAQLGNPDMRTPIANALAWPERIDAGVEPLDLFDVARLDFEKPDMARFPCLRLCYEAIETGGNATTILNAANEIAVGAFLEKRIAFTDIARIVEETLAMATISNDTGSLDKVLAADAEGRKLAAQTVRQRAC